MVETQDEGFFGAYYTGSWGHHNPCGLVSNYKEIEKEVGAEAGCAPARVRVYGTTINKAVASRTSSGVHDRVI